MALAGERAAYPGGVAHVVAEGLPGREEHQRGGDGSWEAGWPFCGRIDRKDSREVSKIISYPRGRK